MNDSRDQPPEQGRRAPIVAAGSRLSPIQQAWADFVEHVTATCAGCRDIDEPRCEGAEHLYRAWRDLTEDAYRQLGG